MEEQQSEEKNIIKSMDTLFLKFSFYNNALDFFFIA
jgi:hypothetical protein